MWSINKKKCNSSLRVCRCGETLWSRGFVFHLLVLILQRGGATRDIVTFYPLSTWPNPRVFAPSATNREAALFSSDVYPLMLVNTYEAVVCLSQPCSSKLLCQSRDSLNFGCQQETVQCVVSTNLSVAVLDRQTYTGFGSCMSRMLWLEHAINILDGVCLKATRLHRRASRFFVSLPGFDLQIMDIFDVVIKTLSDNTFPFGSRRVEKNKPWTLLRCDSSSDTRVTSSCPRMSNPI
jgi:hypothetical protein